MKKIFTLLLMLLLSRIAFAQVSVWDGTHEPWTHGTGTEDDPFLIENAQQLAYLSYRVNNGLDANGGHVSNHDYHYKMMIDVDLNGSENFQWTPIGYWSSDTEYQCFGGHFDGNGHTILGLFINSSVARRVGLFGYVFGATVSNLSVTNGQVTSTSSSSIAGGIIGLAKGVTNVINCQYVGNVSTSASGNCGGIVGNANDNACIINCHYSGSVNSSGSNSYCGGVVGSGGALTITNCFNEGNVTSNYNYNSCGGIVGRTNAVTIITNCYNTGNVSAGYYCGGIVGHRNGNTAISNCYNAGSLAGNFRGGIVGYSSSTGATNNSYYLNTCGGNNTYGGQPLSSDAMQSEEFVTMLNNGSLTYIRDVQPYVNQGYPIFSGFIIETNPATSLAYTSATLHGAYTIGIYNINSLGFQYKKTTDQEYTTVNCTAGQTPYSYNLNNLQHSTSYHYRAFATAAEGTAYGELVQFTTLTPPAYTITASAAGGGSISPSGAITIYEGDSQTFTITPNTNFAIQSVLVDGVSVGAVSTYTFQNVTANHTITVTFRSLIHHITATASGTSGNISPYGYVEVMEGQSQTFTITPTGNSAIQAVLVDGNDVGAVTSYTFQNVTANHTIEAVFYEPGRHQITANVFGPGFITPNGTVSVIEGENQTFEISTIAQSILDSVKIDNVNIGPVTSYTFNNVTEDHTICAYFSLIATPDLNPWDGMTINEPFFFDNIYYICSPTELAWVAQQTNNGNSFSGKSIYIMNDLDLGGAQSIPSTWIPIGISSNSFTGVVNGNDNIIKNLYCNNAGNDNVGLFGFTASASIANIQLRDINVVGHSNVGGLIGYLYNSSVDYCGVTGSVTGGGENVGGLIGYCHYGNNGNCDLANCFAIVEVDANENGGGLIGTFGVYTYSNLQSNLQSSFSAGKVHSQSVSGGLIGVVQLNSYLNITGCYSNATVTGTKCGGIIGDKIGDYYYLHVNESYVSGSVKNGCGFIWNSGTVAICSNCFFDSQSTGCGDNGITGVSAKMTNEMTNSIGFGMTSSTWVYTDGLYPQINTLLEAQFEMSKLSVSPIFLQNNENSSEVHSNFQLSTANGVTWSSSDTDVIGVNGSNANVSPMMIAKTVTLTASLNGVSKQINVTVAGSDTIFVYQPDELRLVAEQCAAGVTYEGKYVKLMNDIEFEFGVPNNMTQIGSYPDHPFMGTLDGNGKVIRNVYIDHPNNEYQGFFGYTKDANLYEVGLENLTISGRNYTGGLVSYAENSYIRDSYVNGGTLFALNYVGGLVGYQSPGTNSVICGCYNTCEVTGNNYLGGLVGFSDQATVRNSYVIAPVSGNGNAVGAIIGRADQVLMYNCYFSIEETGQTQAIGENNLKTIQDGDEGLHSSEMKTAEFVDKLNRNLVVQVWRSDYANNINNGFPIIKWQPDYNNPCQPPVNLMVNEVGGLYARLSWQGAADSYVVAYGKDGVYNQTITTSENNLRLEGLQLNTDYVWKVKAVCGDYETEYVIGQAFKTQGNDVDENGSMDVAVYPNPTNGNITIEAEDLKYIIISNMLGQIINEGSASGNMFEYDFGKHGAGLYLIRIETADGVALKKVSVAR